MGNVNDDATEAEAMDGDLLENMFIALANAFTEERQKTDAYKELFGAGSSLTGVLRELEHQMTTNVLDACAVIKTRHGVEVNEVQYAVLQALPLLVKIATDDVERTEGPACCVDKAFYMLSEELLRLGTTPDEAP